MFDNSDEIVQEWLWDVPLVFAWDTASGRDSQVMLCVDRGRLMSHATININSATYEDVMAEIRRAFFGSIEHLSSNAHKPPEPQPPTPEEIAALRAKRVAELQEKMWVLENEKHNYRKAADVGKELQEVKVMDDATLLAYLGSAKP